LGAAAAGRARVLEEGGAQWGYGWDLSGLATESVSMMRLGHGIREPVLKTVNRYTFPSSGDYKLLQICPSFLIVFLG
jgi:hypothetical protein